MAKYIQDIMLSYRETTVNDLTKILNIQNIFREITLPQQYSLILVMGGIKTGKYIIGNQILKFGRKIINALCQWIYQEELLYYVLKILFKTTQYLLTTFNF